MRHLLFLSLIALLVGCTAPTRTDRAVPPDAATAIFAGGCFWCVEEAFEATTGVVEAVSGYTGGTSVDPTYQEVSAGGTGHYEAVRVIYDPSRVSYAQLLDVFWRNVDPFDPTGQFCDKGESYRAAIFPATAAETAAAERSRQAVVERLGRPIAVPVLPSARFYAAEDNHQDYYLRNSGLYKYYKWRCGRAQRLEQVWGPAPT